MTINLQPNGSIPINPSVWTTSAGVELYVTPSAAAVLPAAAVGYVNQGISLAFNGASFELARTPNVFKVFAAGAATAEATVWTPTTGKAFRLLRGTFTVGTQTTLIFKDGTGLTTVFELELPANTPTSFDLGSIGILSGAVNRLLTVTRGTSSTLVGFVCGTEE